MKPRFAFGSGTPPRHVSQIRRTAKKERMIHIEGGGQQKELIITNSDEEFERHCLCLAKEKIPFSVGGRTFGPVDEITDLVNMKNTRFMEISWRNQQEWTVREIDSESKEWDQTELKELIG